MKTKKIISCKWPIVGHEKIQNFLFQSVVDEHIVPTYLFHGPENVGKSTTALFFVQSILCDNVGDKPCGKCDNCKSFLNRTHPDVVIIEKDEVKKNISIDEIREKVIHRHNLSSFSSRYQITVILGAEALSIEAANSLLKTLEEPTSESLIILTTRRIEDIPKTVVSRCQAIEFQLVSTEKILQFILKSLPDIDRNKSQKLAQLSAGKPGLAWRYMHVPDELNKIINENEIFLNLFQSNIYERFSVAPSLLGSTTFIENTQETYIRVNHWLSLLRDMLMSYYNLNEFQINAITQKKIGQLSQKLKYEKIIALINDLLYLKKILTLNVNPRLAMENFFLNI